MFLGDRREDIEATDDQFKAKDTLEQVFELADKVTTQYYVMQCVVIHVCKLYHVVCIYL